jgi:hypothetical protein
MKIATLIAPLALGATLPALAVPAPGVGTFACGGIGADQRATLAERAADANLALEFFVANRGDFVGGADVSLTPLGPNADGGTVHVTADGPICYGRVPPGRYRVEASINGATRGAQADVPASASHPVRIAIAFPESVAPGDLDIRPTPEEKQEARTP